MDGFINEMFGLATSATIVDLSSIAVDSSGRILSPSPMTKPEVQAYGRRSETPRIRAPQVPPAAQGRVAVDRALHGDLRQLRGADAVPRRDTRAGAHRLAGAASDPAGLDAARVHPRTSDALAAAQPGARGRAALALAAVRVLSADAPRPSSRRIADRPVRRPGIPLLVGRSLGAARPARPRASCASIRRSRDVCCSAPP